MPTTNVKELEIVIPKDKLNDLNFIYLKLMEVSLNTLKEISNHSDKNFIELVLKFLPELKNINNDEFLSQWDLSAQILNNEKVEELVNNNSNEKEEEKITKTKIIAKNKLKLPKKSKKIKLTKPKLNVKASVNENPDNVLDQNSTVSITDTKDVELNDTPKLTVKQKPKIKLVKKKIKLTKKV